MTLYPANRGRVSKSTFYCSHSLAHSLTLTRIQKGNPDTAPLDIAPLLFTARDRKQKLPSLQYFDLPPQIAANKEWHWIEVRLYWYLHPGYLYVNNFFFAQSEADIRMPVHKLCRGYCINHIGSEETSTKLASVVFNIDRWRYKLGVAFRVASARPTMWLYLNRKST